jgi:hypothetical protein
MKTAASLWQEYKDTSVVDRAKHFARYTVPSLMVDPLTGNGREEVCYDFQSSGSLLLNNLSSKLTSLLFPSNQPFFKNIVTPELLAQAKTANIPAETVESKLSILEQEATKNLFKNASFAKITKALKLVIATGQALVYRDSDSQKFRVWNLHSFAVKRDAFGDWHCIILKQNFRFEELPLEIQNDCNGKFPGRFKPETKVTMFTQIKREAGTLNPLIRVTTEIDGRTVGPHAAYPLHLSPWVLPVWNLADGEDYARGLVEEYAGDFAKLSILSEQLGLYELDSLELLNFVDPSSGSSVDDLREANSGDYLPGNGTSVHSFEKGDYQKMNAIRASLAEVVQRLSAAFMYTGNTRNAERVTAEEIKKDAREAETMLGGAYSILAESFQSPLAYLMMREVSDQTLSALISRSFYPQILTGLPALNRDIEVQNLIGALSEGAAVIPQLPAIDQRLDPVKVMDMLYRNRSVNTVALFKDEGQLEADAQQAEQQAQAAQQAQAGITQPGTAQPDQLQQIL